MSRILLLLVFLIWMASGQVHESWLAPSAGVGLFLGVFAIVVLVLGLWSRILAREVTGRNLNRSVRRFNKAVSVAQWLIPVWFAFGLFAVGWGVVVRRSIDAQLDSTIFGGLQLPSLLAGTLPAFVAWMGTWWAQYPADRALREQSLLIQLEEDLPVHAFPPFWIYFRSKLRLQLLFTIVPVLMIVVLRDVMALGIRVRTGGPLEPNSNVEAVVMLFAAAAVFILAPEILRRVLQTQPLPDSPLRQRLESMCRRHGLRYRDILLWHTDSNMGNAAVMGIMPRLRYILMSDLLLETMTDEQIEAVFAHEVGHIVHWHMQWYVVFFGILTVFMLGPAGTLYDKAEASLRRDVPKHAADNDPRKVRAERVHMALDVSALVFGAAGILTVFGFISRRFERQADVFAARTIQLHGPVPGEGTEVPAPAAGRRPSYVGPRGATLFASALERVAAINNIPVEARSWCHGSIEKRMRYLQHLSADPTHTTRFDRFMVKLYAAMVAALVFFGAWAAFAGLPAEASTGEATPQQVQQAAVKSLSPG